jgi:hypothetical protein
MEAGKTVGEQEEKPFARAPDQESVPVVDVDVVLSEAGKVADAAAEAAEIKSSQFREDCLNDTTKDEEEGDSDGGKLMSDADFELMMAECRESYQKLLEEKLYNGPLKRWSIKDYSLDESEDEEVEQEEEVWDDHDANVEAEREQGEVRVDSANVEAATC